MAWKNISTELQHLIVEQLPDKSDLARLCRVSKHFQDTVLQSLYKTIVVRAEDEWQLVNLSPVTLLRTLYERPEYIRYIKNISISAPIHQNVTRRCLHWYERDRMYMEEGKKAFEERYAGEYSQEGDEEDGEYSEPSQEVTLSDLGSRLLGLLHQLRDDSLRSFSWQLGTCVPSELLGVSGQLSMNQKQLEFLSIITDSWCQLNNGAQYTNRNVPTLVGFTSLRSISWRGIHLRSDFLALRDALQANSKHLKTLELDLVKWITAELYYNYKKWNQDKPQHFFAYEILQLGSKGQELTFPSLKTLSLSGVSYHIAASEMASAFNFSQLRSLKLNKCPCVEKLLEAVLQARLPVQLTLLELVIETDSLGHFDSLARFLASFRGLEAFNILTHDYKISRGLWEAILLHQSTLKQLVYHERPRRNEQITDKLILPWNRTPANPLHGHDFGLRLSYVGLCCSLSDLDSSLGVLAKDTLLLLHIRRTGLIKYKRHMNYGGSSIDSRMLSNRRLIEARELHSFAAWAFGTYGLPRLQVLAYGDFSYGNRYAQQNILLHKRSDSALNPTNSATQAENTSFEVVDSDCWNRIDNIDAYLNVLEACPVDSLYS